MTTNSFNAKTKLQVGERTYTYYKLAAVQAAGLDIERLPFSIKVMLESVLRNEDGLVVTAQDVRNVANWNPHNAHPGEIPFKLGRVIMQDFTGVPAVVDLAAMRAAMARLGGDPKQINPLVPVDLVIDHSVQVDYFGTGEALEQNVDLEFERNRERYSCLAWASKAFQNFRVVPPATGIVHQVNLEYLASVVSTVQAGDEQVAFPDSLVGTDSHTTMINGLGVVGWGVGGIEAEGVMLGQPVYMLSPEVVGFKLYGELREGTTATDLTLRVVEMLRKFGVVGKFVEFYGSALANLSLPDRATIANMAPEYGATIGFFPVDDETLNFLRRTGRSDEQVALVAAYCQAQGLFRTADTPEPVFTAKLELDLSTVRPSLAGPKRPQDRLDLTAVAKNFQKSLTAPIAERGFGLASNTLDAHATAQFDDQVVSMQHGSVVIAAITSCTNTSNPSVMLAAGLLAKKAFERGLQVAPSVKTSLAPGSRVVTEYLNEAGLTPYLDALGFQTVGYGCTTCIGNSGPLPAQVAAAIDEGKLVAAAVLSGNRNFEGRIHSHVRANYLASPPLVVAYALAGSITCDFATQPIGHSKDGQPVFLADIWPSQAEIQHLVETAVKREFFVERYGNVFDGNLEWNKIAGAAGELYQWDLESTYIQEPPFFQDMSLTAPGWQPIAAARCLGLFGDSITTDHISPAGSIASYSPAGKFLLDKGVTKAEFNSYGSRRGNDRVMTRGTFANIRLKNALLGGAEGGDTLHLPTGDKLSIYDASLRYKQEGTPLVILAGTEYGTGSSRDWAAKGTLLLGVRAVIASSFERIHRSNLVMMGVLPLQFVNGQTWQSLGLNGHEVFDIVIPADLQAQQSITVQARRPDGTVLTFETVVRIDTPVELDYYRNGGILPAVLRKLLG
jgi:aconitate hydratase